MKRSDGAKSKSGCVIPGAPVGPLVQVLLATYNGERYLSAQLDSILAQSGVDVRILVSDDNSTDATLRILHRYQAAYPDRIELLPALPGTGKPKLNFLRLMTASSAAYVALADQDDVWLPQKLFRSMEQMKELEVRHGSESALLVFTDLKVVDHDLKCLNPSFWMNQNIDPARIHSLRNLVVQNVLTGCTSLMNRELLLQSLGMPSTAAMHDWWIALVACVFGHAQALPEPLVLYRQHASNSLGAAPGHRQRFLPRLRSHALRKAEWDAAFQQSQSFLILFRNRLSPETQRILELFASCEHSPNRLVRVWTYLRYRFFLKGLRPNLAMLWYLWDMKAAKRSAATDAATGGA